MLLTSGRKMARVSFASGNRPWCLMISTESEMLLTKAAHVNCSLQTSFNPGLPYFYEDPRILNSTDLEVTFYA